MAGKHPRDEETSYPHYFASSDDDYVSSDEGELQIDLDSRPRPCLPPPLPPVPPVPQVPQVSSKPKESPVLEKESSESILTAVEILLSMSSKESPKIEKKIVGSIDHKNRSIIFKIDGKEQCKCPVNFDLVQKIQVFRELELRSRILLLKYIYDIYLVSIIVIDNDNAYMIKQWLNLYLISYNSLIEGKIENCIEIITPIITSLKNKLKDYLRIFRDDQVICSDYIVQYNAKLTCDLIDEINHSQYVKKCHSDSVTYRNRAKDLEKLGLSVEENMPRYKDIIAEELLEASIDLRRLIFHLKQTVKIILLELDNFPKLPKINTDNVLKLLNAYYLRWHHNQKNISQLFISLYLVLSAFMKFSYDKIDVETSFCVNLVETIKFFNIIYEPICKIIEKTELQVVPYIKGQTRDTLVLKYYEPPMAIFNNLL